MKSRLIVGGALAVSALAWAAKDPVIMTVNGVSVPKSEFEYLYRKNTQQQIEPQPIDRYAEMFAIYKMKVADAREAGLDTAAAFRKEMRQYANELANPYLMDTVFVNKLVDETLARMQQEAEARHIMIFKQTPGARQLADSLHTVLLKGGDFPSLAKRYSEDRASRNNGGSMGYIVAGRFPYTFETAVYNTPEGKYSDVVETDAGYHIILGGKKIPARGSVTAAHIMKAVPVDAPAEVQQAAKASIDSIYNVLVQDPSKFEELARTLSDDKRSGAQGGMLRPFMSGEMIPEFNEAAFALADGEMSAPVKSVYGWHIIRRIDGKALPSAAVLRPNVREGVVNPMSDRGEIVSAHNYDVMAKKLHGSMNKKNIGSLLIDAESMGLDSAFVAKYSQAPFSLLPIYSIGKKQYPAEVLLPRLKNIHYQPGEASAERLASVIQSAYKFDLKDAAIADLEKKEPDFRNLLNEYRDGSLLYEMSLRKVWDKAAKDTEGLNAYFDAHRTDFAWKEPHVKGYLVQAANDSVASAVQTRLAQLAPEDYLKTIRSEFKNQATIDRILMTKGQNAMVDNLAFGAPEVAPSSSNFTTYFIYDQKVLDAPEEVADVKVLVTNAYQNQLESEWVESLKARYPLVINEKELKKIK